jgi:hypothetical protein
MVNVFSFCLYGSGKKYCQGLIENLKIIEKEFPDFQVEVYMGQGVPEQYISEYMLYPFVKLHYTELNNAELMIYRYYPIDSEDVDCMFVRDCDSRVNTRDQWCIREFIKSPKKFHIVRDHFWHKTKITGGLWGIKKGLLSGKIRTIYDQWIATIHDLKGLYDTDQKFLESEIYNLIKDDMLIHSIIVGHKGEDVIPIPDDLFKEDDFIGNVWDFNGDNEFPVFRFSDYPLIQHLKWLYEREQYRIIKSLTEDVDVYSIKPVSNRNIFLNILSLSNCFLNDTDTSQKLLKFFESTHVHIYNIYNSNFVLSRLQFRYDLIGTTDLSREPSDNEIIFYYGNFPHYHYNLPFGNKVYRHAIYHTIMSHTRFEHHPCWDKIAVIYILNLVERKDRYMDILLELCHMGCPLDRVYHYKAKKDKIKGDRMLDAYLGATKNHLDVLDHFRTNFNEDDYCLILEDDFMFTSNYSENQKSLKEFIDRGYEFDICLLSTSKFFEIISYDDLVNLSNQECTTSSGYMIQQKHSGPIYQCFKEGYDKMYTTGDYNQYVCDRYWAKLHRNKKFYMFKKKMGFQRGNYSSICDTFICNFD